MIRNIIFDWSGTLVDDLPAVWRATNHVLGLAERPELSLEQFRAEFTLPFTDFYDRHTPHIPLPQLEEWFHGRFRQVQDTVTQLPHARAFLEFCRMRNVRMFLLSTVAAEHFAAQQLSLGLSGYFEQAYVGVWDKRKRIHEILGDNGLNADETLFVGDMQHDIETARHGGICSAAVLTGYNTLAQLRAAQPHVIVEHLGELQEILRVSEMDLGPFGRRRPELLVPVVTVGGLIFNDAGEVLMIRTHKWSDLWGIPGGKIKLGEPSEAALRRELKEETNLEVTDIRFALVQDSIHSPEFYRDAHFVLLNYTCRCVGAPDVKLNDEAREFRWVSGETALTLPLNTPTRVLLEAVMRHSENSNVPE